MFRRKTRQPETRPKSERHWPETLRRRPMEARSAASFQKTSSRTLSAVEIRATWSPDRLVQAGERQPDVSLIFSL